MDGEHVECLDGPEGCKGKVEYRMTSDRAMTDFKSFPRCEAHFEKREASARDAVEAGYFSDTVPSWFDASYAGEHWDDDY